MILEQTYDRDNFLDFLDGFLPDFGRDTRDITLSSQQFSDIHSLGVSQNLDLQILEVKVKGSLDKRVSIASDAFKLMKTTASYRTLVAFYSEDSKQWRLSLMTAQPTISEGKVITKLSSPRRFSYLLGPDSKLNTPNKQLIIKGKVADFDDLSNRFALEVVNNEFYKEIAKLYDELVGTDKATGVLKYPGRGEVSHEFAVRLMGRIIFCWFLREKRSDHGTPLVPASILSREAANHKNYYHDVLAPLFFEVLNKHLRSREEKFQKNEYANVPYLNGGLFNPDTDDHYRFDKNLQLSVPGLVDVPDSWLHKFLDLLELYNFTVDENTSYDIDLSIDPEMLGRIFENLLARINPETGETVRKMTGSFYTPREIVEYMVDECLKEYLRTETKIHDNKLVALASFDLSDDADQPLNNDEKVQITNALSKIKVLDPACGSGAFPIGVLQKIVFMLQQVDPDAKLWFEKQLKAAGPELRHHLEREYENKNFDYLRKLGVIRESVYGVDIQPIATEISRLRCFLTLIVDQSVDDNEPNRGVEPLPNLDFKFVTANSLIGLGEVESSSKGQTGLFEDRASIDELRELRDEYFTSHNSERENIKTKFTQVQNKMLRKMLEQRSGDFADTTSRLSAWDPFSHESTQWFDPEWMFGINDGFHVVIANPPYLKERDNHHIFDPINQSDLGKKYHQGKMDFWYYFLHRAIDLCKEEGVISYITSRYWLNSFGAKKLIQRIKKELQFTNLVDIGKIRVFNEVVGQHMVAVYIKTNIHRTFIYKKLETDLRGITNSEDNEYVTIKHLENNKVITKNLEIILEDSSFLDIKGSVPLGSICDSSVGVQESPDKVTEKMLRNKPSDEIRAGDGVFVLTEAEINLLKLNDSERRIVKKYLDPNDVAKYGFFWKNKYLIYSDKVARQLIASEPSFVNLKGHLDKYRDYITSSNGPYGLHRAREARFFDNPKIIFKGMFEDCQFTLDTDGYHVGFSFSLIIQKDPQYDLRYILAVLNSSFAKYWFTKYGKKRGIGLDIGIEKLRLFPIMVADPEAQQPLISIVDELLSNYSEKSENHKTKMHDLEEKLNELVYGLYRFSPDEIKIIEENT